MTKPQPLDLYGPGQMRVVGEPREPGLPLLAQDVALEVLQRDGAWVPLRGVVEFRLSLRHDQIASVHDLTVEMGLVDITALTRQVRPVASPLVDTRPIWRRWYWRARIFNSRFRQAWQYARRHS